jgi:hypothetical protein
LKSVILGVILHSCPFLCGTSVGYGFKFATGVDILLDSSSNSQEDEHIFAVCPPKTECFGKTQNEEDEPDDDDSTVDQGATSMLFKCSSSYAAALCEVLTYTDSSANIQTYGKYGNYGPCNCPLSQVFLKKYVSNPDTPMWEHVMNGDCTNSSDGDSTSPPTISTNAPTVDWDSAVTDTNGAICGAAQNVSTGCESMPFPGCEKYYDGPQTEDA